MKIQKIRENTTKKISIYTRQRTTRVKTTGYMCALPYGNPTRHLQ